MSVLEEIKIKYIEYREKNIDKPKFLCLSNKKLCDLKSEIPHDFDYKSDGGCYFRSLEILIRINNCDDIILL